MQMRKFFSGCFCAIAAVTAVAAVEVSLNPGGSVGSWNLILGTEFPGAKGSVKIDGGSLVGSWDFSGGGGYS